MDTLPRRSGVRAQAAPRLRLEAGAEPIPGYRLVAPLGRGGFGEVWKCEAPGGLVKAIKFVLGELHPSGDGDGALRELEALQRVKTIRHPFVLSLERIERIAGDLVIVTELADQCLHDVWQDCRGRGLPGIKRDRLIAWLAEAAEALDHLNVKHGLLHLDVKPKNLFLVSDHVKVADFGRVQCLRERNAAGGRVAAVSPPYMPPEVLQGSWSRHSDQYSLAIVYQELLTGRPPFAGRNSRQLAFQHARETPDLVGAPASDRDIIARALSKEPEQRFASCRDFIRALAAAGPPPTPPLVIRPVPAVREPDTPLPRQAAALDDHTVADPLRDTSLNLSPVPAAPPEEEPELAPASCEFLPRHRFLNCVARTPVSETWLVQVPDGRRRLARIVFGFADPGASAPDPLAKLLAIEHPSLARAEVILREASRAVLMSDLPDGSLRDRLVECQARELPGVPRVELLGWLGAAAQALDTLADTHSLFHLGLNPNALLIERGRLRLAEFGLAHGLWGPAGHPVAQFNLRYSAPELFVGQPHRASDQYSLALIYCELLTAAHPLHGQPRPRGPGERYRSQPDLRLLSRPDREAISRALHPDPRQRFGSCTELIRALEECSGPPVAAAAAESRTVSWPSVISWPIVAASAGPVTALEGASLDELVPLLLTEAAGAREVKQRHQLHYVLHPGELLEHRCAARLPPGVARLKLGGFAEQWRGEIVRQDDDGFLLRVGLVGSFWQRCVGARPGLEVRIRLLPQRHATALTEVNVAMRPVDCGRDQAVKVLQQMGPAVLESLRTFLQAYPEQRRGQRLPWPGTVRVCQAPDDLSPPRFIEGRGKDVSPTGLGFVLPAAPTAQLVYVNPAGRHADALAILARVVRVRPLPDGWYEVGARFAGLTESSKRSRG